MCRKEKMLSPILTPETNASLPFCLVSVSKFNFKVKKKKKKKKNKKKRGDKETQKNRPKLFFEEPGVGEGAEKKKKKKVLMQSEKTLLLPPQPRHSLLRRHSRINRDLVRGPRELDDGPGSRVCAIPQLIGCGGDQKRGWRCAGAAGAGGGDGVGPGADPGAVVVPPSRDGQEVVGEVEDHG